MRQKLYLEKRSKLDSRTEIQMKFSWLLLMVSILPLHAFANTSDTVCDVDGYDVSFDIGSSTPQDSGPRPFYALEIGKKGHVEEKGVHQILSTSPTHKIDFKANNGDFSLKITSTTKHKLVFYAKKETASDGTVKTDASSSIKGFGFPHATFSCH
jgi:hypothetical protein